MSKGYSVHRVDDVRVKTEGRQACICDPIPNQ